MFSCILVRFQKDQKLASSSGLRGTPILVGPDSQAACTSGIRCSLSTFTGGCHCRGGGRCGLPPRTRALRTSPRALAPWAPGSVFEADVFNPLIEFLEQGIIIRFLVIKDNLSWSTGWRKFFTDRLDTLLQFALVSAWYWVWNYDYFTITYQDQGLY